MNNEPTYQELLDELKTLINEEENSNDADIWLEEEIHYTITEHVDDDHLCTLFAEKSLQQKPVTHVHSRGNMTFSEAMRSLLRQELFEDCMEYIRNQ